MKPDPPVRKDGRCSVCRKPRHPERSRTYGDAVAELDPFCCTEHCRQWHGVEMPTPSVKLKKDGR